MAMVAIIQSDDDLLWSLVTEALGDIQNKLDVHCQQQCCKEEAIIQKAITTLSTTNQELTSSANATTDLQINVTESI
jgi:hypothetical protein